MMKILKREEMFIEKKKSHHNFPKSIWKIHQTPAAYLPNFSLWEYCYLIERKENSKLHMESHQWFTVSADPLVKDSKQVSSFSLIWNW